MNDKEYKIKDVHPEDGWGCAEFVGNQLLISPTLSDILTIDRNEWEKMKRWVDENWPADEGAS